MHDQGEGIDSPSPVMTFQIAGIWLAVPVEQVERIASVDRLWPVPLASAEHMGLLDDNGELLPVMRLPFLPPGESTRNKVSLAAVLHVRGESVGVLIDLPGRVQSAYRLCAPDGPPPAPVSQANPTCGLSAEGRFWILDPDRLWQSPVAHAGPTTPIS